MMQQRLNALAHASISDSKKAAQTASANYYMDFILPEASSIASMIAKHLD